MAEIILDKINYTYSDGTAYEIQALKDVNLQIHQGEFIGITTSRHRPRHRAYGIGKIDSDSAAERTAAGIIGKHLCGWAGHL